MNVSKLMPLVLALSVGCSTQSVQTRPTTSSSAGGATSAQAAAEAFLGAVRTQDLTALSLVWGTAQGPSRASLPAEQVEMRGTIMMRYLKHDSAQLLDNSTAAGGLRMMRVELTCNGRRATTTLTAVPTAEGRWYVQNVELEPVRDLCRT